MIEQIVLNFMAERLPVPVSMELPADPPEQFVVLKKGDSSRENFVDTSMFVADSYADSLFHAAQLNERVIAAFDDLTDLDLVSSSTRGGDYAFPDTYNKKYRYQAIQTITHY